MLPDSSPATIPRRLPPTPAETVGTAHFPPAGCLLPLPALSSAPALVAPFLFSAHPENGQPLLDAVGFLHT